MFKLRYYQLDAIEAVTDYFKNNKGNPVIAQPTGTGKSLVIAGFLKRTYYYYPTQRIIMLTHVKELIEQNFNKLIALWPTAPVGIYSAGLNRRDVDKKITYAGIQSVAKKAHLFGHIDLIIIDECDLVSHNQNTGYRKFIDALMQVNPNLKVIGLSATPFRLGLGMITDGGIFTDICYDDTGLERFNALIAEGYLLPPIPKKTKAIIDVTGVHKSGGEFKIKELQQATDKEEITYNAVREMVEEGSDRKHWLIFGTGIEHCYHIAEMLENFGISSAVVHSSTADYKITDEQRNENIRLFKAGKIQALVNNNVLTTGFDYPDIDLIGVLRATESSRLWIQMLGRGIRPVYADGFDLSITEQRLQAIAASQKQNCLVFDFAGNTLRNGPINDPLIPNKKKGKGKGKAPVRICEMCNVYNHASARTCINCGFIFPIKTKIHSRSSDMELITDAIIELPVIEEFKVTKISYARHLKQDRPDSIKVIYYCGLRRFTEYICLEHGGLAGKRARDWWRNRSSVEVPTTTSDALGNMTSIRSATHLKVHVNQKYPKVINYALAPKDDRIKEPQQSAK